MSASDRPGEAAQEREAFTNISPAEFQRLKRQVGITYFPGGVTTEKAQLEMLQWANLRGLRLSKANPCFIWLTQGRCRGVVHVECGGWPSNPWFDHGVCFTHDGKPACVVGQPYDLSQTAINRLMAATREQGLRAGVRGAGWYGHGTCFVEVWNPSNYSLKKWLPSGENLRNQDQHV